MPAADAHAPNHGPGQGIYHRAIAIVGVGAVLPDAPDSATFWDNIRQGRYSIAEVPEERWDPRHYYDPDPKTPDKSYSKIGGWVTDWEWNPLAWRLPIPPKVSDAMDRTQKWAIATTRQALEGYKAAGGTVDSERTAVIFGNAMAGDRHYRTALRLAFPEVAEELGSAPSFSELPPEIRQAITRELHEGIGRRLPEITEDTMPGELANIIAGRVANVFDLHGPNFVVDAACASTMAALDAAVEGLEEHDYDLVITGGIDANMSASTFIKFCKIGALSATGTRPYAEGADGFVMGEGGVAFLLRRLADAERDGDPVFAVIRGVGGSSDGKGKGITAPNPVGQRLALERGWAHAGLDPATVGLIEGHGTSTRVGDVVEVDALNEVFDRAGLAPGSVPLGSVKSNIGHLKGAAGAAGILKAALALRDKVLPPSLGFARPNPAIDFSRSPFFVNTELRPWETRNGTPRRAGVSAFGFGGTNFHTVLEEHIPGRLTGDRRSTVAVRAPLKAPLRGALVLGAATTRELAERLRAIHAEAEAGRVPPLAAPAEADLRAPERLTVDFGDAAELAKKTGQALEALDQGSPVRWRLLRGRGIFRGSGAPGKVAFLYTGQGSQYANMLRELAELEPVVKRTFDEADAVMEPQLGKPLTDVVFVDGAENGAALAQTEEGLRQTAITQPAVLTVDVALTRLLAEYGLRPDLVMGHSLGEYGALVAAGALPFSDALEAVSARGLEMTRVSTDDNGWMAAVSAPPEEVNAVLEQVDGYVVAANHNSTRQAVIGGATEAVQKAMEALQETGYSSQRLPVSHAFHTRIVAPAGEPLRKHLERLDLRPPEIPVITNVTGDFYPTGPAETVVPEMIDILARQIASPVRFVEGLRNLHTAGARVFAEVGPKRALYGFVDDVLGKEPDVHALFTNHPKQGDVASFNQALCALWAAGLGVGNDTGRREGTTATVHRPPEKPEATPPAPETGTPDARSTAGTAPGIPTPGGTYTELGHLFADFLDRGFEVWSRHRGTAAPAADVTVTITGTGLGLPGTERVFDDANVARILRGEPFIDAVPTAIRRSMADKHITRLVKNDTGEPHFDTIDSPAEVIKLAGRGGALDLVQEFGFPEERRAALDVVTELAIGAGLDALRDAGIPLVLRYKTTTKGTYLPDRWGLPEALRDDTGVIFASAFPGYESLVEQLDGYQRERARRERLEELRSLRGRLAADGRETDPLASEIDRRIEEVERELDRNPFVFDRRFLFRVLAMGHAQLAELIGARGPNTQINAACASGTQAVGLASDWIRAGRCRRVVVISADNVTSDRLLEWFGAGFLATGAAATDDVLEDAALPFDRRRHGMLLGMGAAALVVESADGARERGLAPICEVLETEIANSAFHGTRLDVGHISDVMQRLMARAEARWGIDRHEIAPQTMFVSHETYTPARGGSAAAEVHALRQTFGPSADRVVVANTKGFTGHPMAVAIEDVVAVKALETGLVPPVPNYREVDPELGELNLSRGGSYPVRYALRLGAGFGSQISLSLLRWVPTADGRRPHPEDLGYRYRITDPAAWQGWLSRVSGYPAPQVEVVQRKLRVKDEGPATRTLPPPALQVEGKPQETEPPTAEPSEDLGMPRAEGTPADSAATGDEVQARVLAIIAEQTGYPPDMLDLDLDLEADLGIDTVKQAEMFAAIRAEWDIPRDDELQLRDFPTLAHAIQFVYDRKPELSPSLGVEGEKGVDEALPRESTAEDSRTEESQGEVGLSVEEHGDKVQQKVLAIIAEQTGYPPEMLDLDLDLEADLGIDTVKQAEMFAAIRAEWDIPRDDELQLRDFPTLAHAIQFVYDRKPELRPGAQSDAHEEEHPGELTEPSPLTQPGSEGPADGGQTGNAGDATLRHIPVAVLRPPLELCKATGVELGEDTRVVIALDHGGVGQALVSRLEKRGVEVLAIDGVPEPGELEERLRTFAESGPVHGVYWLPALDAEGDPAQLEPEDWRRAVRRRVKNLYTALRTLYDTVGVPGTFLVSATRLGGRHGHGGEIPETPAPLGGAVTGLTKTIAREKPEALVKAVDFAPSRKTAALADVLVDETLRDPGAVEIGIDGDASNNARRWTVSLETRPLETEAPEDVGPGPELGPETVFLITGAAGSIVSAITADLARASGGTFHLLDRVPEPDPADPDLALYRSDREALKREIFERLKTAGERATPARVETELAALERADAALAALEAVQEAGGTAHYHAVDLLDGEAVAAAVRTAVETSGSIDVLIHAGGLEISHLLPNKPPEEFDRVFDVKADGWYHLLRGLEALRETVDRPPAAAVVFSSIAGRFGNAGQADYSAANDFLVKSVAAFRVSRPETRGLALDWTAWGGIGMATRGSIPQVMAAAGIDLLPPEAGIPMVRRELTLGPPQTAPREVVVAGRLGVMAEERDATGGLDPEAVRDRAERASGPLAGEVVAMGPLSGLVVEIELDPKSQPFLDHHRIGDTPVLPGVMGIEAFAETARRLFPGLHVAAVEDVRFLAPFKFFRDEPRTLTVHVQYTAEGEELVAACRLTGSRLLPGKETAQITTHFTGRVRLSPEPPEEETVETSLGDAAEDGSERATAEDIYRIYFHGPAYRVLEGAWRHDGEAIGRLASGLPPDHRPEEVPELMAPRLIELCFQTAGVWDLGRHGRMALPREVRRVRVLKPADDTKGELTAVVRPTAGSDESPGFDARVVDADGRMVVELEGYRTVELPGGVEEEALPPLKKAMAGD